MTTKQAEPVRQGEECQCTACRHRVLIEAKAAKIAAEDMRKRCAEVCEKRARSLNRQIGSAHFEDVDAVAGACGEAAYCADRIRALRP